MSGDKKDPRISAEAEGDGFLRRWSRRKGAQAKTQPNTAAREKSASLEEGSVTDVADAPASGGMELPPEAPVRGRMITTPPGEAENPAQGDAEAQEEGPVEEADLPDVEELSAESDFTPFMKKGVSEQLQRRALRKLWLSDPVLANVDGLLDYGDDFTDAAMVVENLKTVYTVGRGMVPAPEEAEDAEAEEAVAEDAETGDAETGEAETGDAESGEAVGEDAESDPGRAEGDDAGQEIAHAGEAGGISSDKKAAMGVARAGAVEASETRSGKEVSPVMKQDPKPG